MHNIFKESETVSNDSNVPEAGHFFRKAKRVMIYASVGSERSEEKQALITDSVVNQ